MPTVLATLKSEKTAYQGESFAFIRVLRNIIAHTIRLLSVQKEQLKDFSLYTFQDYDVRKKDAYDR